MRSFSPSYLGSTYWNVAAGAPPVRAAPATRAGMQTGLALPNSGETAPRDFHANIVTLGFHYEF